MGVGGRSHGSDMGTGRCRERAEISRLAELCSLLREGGEGTCC